ncbi:DUF1127 domain-containing protein [Neptuniibacter sp. QD48_55]|uniref:DUF1127 domain-containing protein n=1 Tax=Neptuniibacter sp. QD48_55 TaxID=3398212 RepID=UPI0039F5C6F1
MSIQVCENYQPSKEIRNSYPLPTIDLHKLAFTLKQWRQNYRTRKALLKLSDEQLKDIDLSREQAHKEASKAFWVR